MIKDDNKVVLLTIFLYIALNLRTIERFVQNGHIVEPFTAIGDNEKAKIITQGIVKSIMMLFIIGYFIFMDDLSDVNMSSRIKKNPKVATGVFVFVFCIFGFSVGVVATKSIKIYDAVLYYQSLLIPITHFMYIYVAIKTGLLNQQRFLNEKLK